MRGRRGETGFKSEFGCLGIVWEGRGRTRGGRTPASAARHAGPQTKARRAPGGEKRRQRTRVLSLASFAPLSGPEGPQSPPHAPRPSRIGMSDARPSVGGGRRGVERREGERGRRPRLVSPPPPLQLARGAAAPVASAPSHPLRQRFAEVDYPNLGSPTPQPHQTRRSKAERVVEWASVGVAGRYASRKEPSERLSRRRPHTTHEKAPRCLAWVPLSLSPKLTCKEPPQHTQTEAQVHRPSDTGARSQGMGRTPKEGVEREREREERRYVRAGKQKSDALPLYLPLSCFRRFRERAPPTRLATRTLLQAGLVRGGAVRAGRGERGGVACACLGRKGEGRCVREKARKSGVRGAAAGADGPSRPRRCPSFSLFPRSLFYTRPLSSLSLSSSTPRIGWPQR